MKVNVLMLGSDDSALNNKSYFRKNLLHLCKYWKSILILAPSKKGLKGFYKIGDNIWYYFFPSFWRMMFFALSRHKIDTKVIISMDPFWYGLMAFFLHKGDQKIILELHSHNLFNNCWIKYRKRNIFYHMIARILIPKAHYVRAVYYDEKLFERYNNIYLIPSNYTDINLFKPNFKIKKDYDVIYVGRLHPQKNINYLLKVMCFLVKKGYRCLIVGEGDKKYLREIRRCGILYMGWVSQEELSSIYNKAKVLLITSYGEGNPRVAYEALSSGCLVVTTNTGLITKTLSEHRECGRIISGENIEKDVKIIEDALFSYNEEDIKKCVGEIRKKLNYEEQIKKYGMFVVKAFQNSITEG